MNVRSTQLSWGLTWQRIVFLVGIACLYFPLFFFTYFPSQDGPAHVGAAAAMNRIDSGDPFFGRYFTSTGLSSTNWAEEIIYGFLVEKAPASHVDMLAAILFVSLALTVIHLCSRLLLKISFATAVLFYPLVFSHMLSMGSYNLCLATLGFFFAVATCCAYEREQKPSFLYVLALSLLMTCALHVEIACLALLAAGLFGLWQGRSRYVKHGLTRPIVLVAPLVACVPAMVWLAAYTVSNSSKLISHVQPLSIIARLEHMILLTGLSSYSLFGLTVCAGYCFFIAVFAFVLFKKGRPDKARSSNWLLLSGLILTFLSIGVPDGYGDIFNIQERMMVPALMAVLMWLSLQLDTASHQVMVLSAVVLLLFLQCMDRVLAFSSLSKTAREFYAIEGCVPDGAALISVDLDLYAPPRLSRSPGDFFRTSTRFSPFLNVPGLLFADRQVVDASNYEALAICPYFPLKYQPWLNSMVGDTNIGIKAATELETKAFSRFIVSLDKAAYPIDYLLTSDVHRQSHVSPSTEAVNDVVEAHYDLVCSSPSNLARVYRRKPGND
jgi:hypothetical protein